MGEFIGAGGATAALPGGLGVISALVSVVALGLFALFQADKENDDDDSNPGGGLMQPVSGAA